MLNDMPVAVISSVPSPDRAVAATPGRTAPSTDDDAGAFHAVLAKELESGTEEENRTFSAAGGIEQPAGSAPNPNLFVSAQPHTGRRGEQPHTGRREDSESNVEDPSATQACVGLPAWAMRAVAQTHSSEPGASVPVSAQAHGGGHPNPGPRDLGPHGAMKPNAEHPSASKSARRGTPEVAQQAGQPPDSSALTQHDSQAVSEATLLASANRTLARHADDGAPVTNHIAQHEPDATGLVLAPQDIAQAAAKFAGDGQPLPPPRVGEQGWNQSLGDKLIWMASERQHVAELHLNPPELGPLKIVLTVTHENASAQFVSAHAPVRDAIQQALPHLHQMLAESGITLGNTSVSADAFQGQAQHQSYVHGAATVLDDVQGPVRTIEPLRALQGLVDTFA